MFSATLLYLYELQLTISSSRYPTNGITLSPFETLQV